MKHTSEKDLDTLSSMLLGFMAIGLLLIPLRLNALIGGLPSWAPAWLGVFAFIISLSTQIFFVLNAHQKRIIFFRGLSIVCLFTFSALFFRASHYVEGIIVLVTGIAQLISVSPLKFFFARNNSIKITATTIAFACGLVLAIPNGQYAPLNFSPLAIAFLTTALLGTLTIIFPTLKNSALLFRLEIIPWLAWCFIFTPGFAVTHLIAPALLITMIIFSGILPWDRFCLPEDDILGRRLIMIASTLELTLLIFLSALLYIIDRSIAPVNQYLLTARDAAFLFFMAISLVLYYEVSTIIMTINGLMQELGGAEDERGKPAPESNTNTWNNRLARYIKPFMLISNGLRIRLTAQANQSKILAEQLTNEKKRNTQLTLLLELSQQLESQLDQPVAAQLAMNTLERALECSLASLYVHEPDQKQFMLLAAAGEQTNMMPSGYRQSISDGVIGRAVRQRKTQIVNDIKADADYICFDNEPNLSAVVIPIIYNGHANGTIVLNSLKVNGFGSIDIALAEAVAAELSRAWERSGYQERLMNLVQAGSQLASMVEPESTAREVAFITREILQARFTFVHIQLGQERNFAQSASAGKAPRLLESLEKSINSDALMQTASQAVQPFRVRDVRKYAATSHLMIDHPGLRSMLTIPIRWHRINIGAIFAFGKKNEVFFTENDEALAELLSIQTAGAFESTWLQQELRASLRITSLLYRLSNQIIQAENLEHAASDIAQTAHKLAKSTTTGIILLTPSGDLITEMQIDSSGIHHGIDHPMDLIKDTMQSGQLIYISLGNSTVRSCLPIQTPVQKYGAIWMDAPEDQGHKPTANPNDLQALVNQAAIALERSLLWVESQRQALEIKGAYDKLEATYDQTLESLMSALDARDRETEGHSTRVAHLVAKLGEALGYSSKDLKVLERGSLLHDIGKIGISDTILHKPGPLSEEEWKIMRLHPDIGAKIVAGIPFLQETIPLIRHHQEKWDGTGYPEGLHGEEIPALARIFSVVDTFDALTSKRPYRNAISASEAVDYLREQAGIIFDPNIVETFEKLIMTETKST
jgi:putative nucleotidyltransferase with HDIG domain